MTRAVRRSGGRLARCRCRHPKDSLVASPLEELLSSGEHVVQCVLEVRGAFGELAADLLDVFLVALLDLLAEELLQRSVAHPFLPLLREVRDDVRDEGA